MEQSTDDMMDERDAVSTYHAMALSPEVRPEPEAGTQLQDRLVLLMNAYERPIFNFLLHLARDVDLAMDCAQDTFLRAYENLRKGRPVNGPWLYKVARNRAMDEFRRRPRFLPAAERLEQTSVHELTDQVIAVQSTMDRLSPADREVLYLFEVAGFKTEEIGALLGVRGSAVRQRLPRADQRFRAFYGAEP